MCMSTCQEGAWSIIFSGVGSLVFFCDIPSFLASCFMKRTECFDITGSSNFQPLPWNLRMKVALEAARGLAFLHGDQTKVIYRDFKTSNILLDSVCLQTILSICAIQMNFYLKIRNYLTFYRNTMQNCLISVWQKTVQVVIKVMFLLGSWGHKDMLPLNILQQVIFVT